VATVEMLEKKATHPCRHPRAPQGVQFMRRPGRGGRIVAKQYNIDLEWQERRGNLTTSTPGSVLGEATIHSTA